MSSKHFLQRLQRWLPGGKEKFREEIRAELQEHVAQLVADNIAHGMSPEQAERMAQSRFGSSNAINEQCQSERAVFRFEELITDFQYGLRLLRRTPGFAVVAILTLALGIGANTAIFSLVQGVLLQELPFKDPRHVLTSRGFSIPDYEDFAQSTRSFDRTALWASNLYTVVVNGEAEQIPGIVATPDLFDILGAPIRGRTFRSVENDQPLVILSYEMWQSRFGGSDAALGQTINLGGTPHTIVGVMPRGFHFPSAQYKFWVTFGSSINSVPEQKRNRSLRIFGVVGHLRPGVNLSEAQTEMQAFSERQTATNPDTNRNVQFTLQPILESTIGNIRSALMILLGTVGFVLLIACANVANLLLARTASRRRELAVRVALGAKRLRIVRQLLCESVLLSLIGGAFGLALAFAGLQWLKEWHATTIPRLDSIDLNWVVLTFSFGLSVITGVVFGILPALHAVPPDVNDALKEGGRTSSMRQGARMRPTLVIVEIALAMVVTVGAGLLVKSFVVLTNVDPGFSSDHLVTGMSVLVDIKAARRPAVVAAMLEQIAKVAGVENAAAGTGLPPETAQRVTKYEVSGSVPAAEPQYAYFLSVTDQYLPTLQTPLLAGRNFGPQDTVDSPKVVIVSERLVRTRYGSRNPVGEQLKIINPDQSPEWRTIVGVVRDVRYGGLDDTDAPAIYTPYPQNPHLLGGIYLIIRSRADNALVINSIQQAVKSTAAGLYAVNLHPMKEIVDNTVSTPRLNASLLSLFSGLALVLSATGIYGLIAYSVSQRIHEIGVRIALGASTRNVVLLIMRNSMFVVGIGIVAGLLGGLASSRVLRNLLFEVQPSDPSVFVVVALCFVLVGLLASYVPARRATKIDPIAALRHE